MAYEQLCMYCFEDLQGQVICPHCGRDSRAAVPQIQMLPGTLVYHDRFLVGRALGQDATGIVYSAFDTKRENKLRLREYLPRDCAERLNDGSVVPTAGLEDQFEKGMKKLRASVEGVEDPQKRHFYFEENGTAYIAQRKSAAGAAAAAARDDEDEGRGGFKSLGVIIGVAAAIVVVVAIVIVSMVNGALRSADDLVQNPTLAPSASANLWAPEATPSPTPYATPTFAALVDPEQSWMDYTYSGDVNKDFENQLSQASTPKPTIRPEATQNTTVGGNSSNAEVTALQQRLVELGWLKADGITGKYDSATKQAVKDFQNYVNTAIRPAQKLSVDGIAGPKTQQWLYGTDSVKPTPTPTPVVTPDPEQDMTVDADSPKNDIKAVQRKLIVLGLMNSGSDDGVYGTTTTAAVKKFQQRVNQLQGYNALPISGTVDPDTMAYLNYYVEWWENLQQATATPEPVLPTTPTPAPATPTPAPTETPEPDAPDKEETGTTVDKNSPKESIAFVQEMLIGVGLLPEGSNDGVYGSGTTNAVIAFQQWVNEKSGAEILSVTGVADANTLNYLEYAYGNGMSAKPTEAPATPTPAPVVTEAPVQPVDLSLSIGGAESVNGVYNVTGDRITFQWAASGAVSDYYVYVYDGNGDLFFEREATDSTGGVFGASELQPGMVYTITIGALPVGGDETSMTWTEASFCVPAAQPTEAPATATPAPTETPAPEAETVTPDSPKESIASMQSMLIGVGLLPDGSSDGVYGNGTKNAVAAFQQWVNEQRGAEVLSVTGIADQDTLKYLEYAVSNGMSAAPKATEAPTPTEAPATATPAPAETPEPEAPDQEETGTTVTPDSPKESIAFVQEMLIGVGLLPDGSSDGVYGNGTKNAVAAFQQWVNEQRGAQVLEVTGIADQETLNYLEYAWGNGMSAAPAATEAPVVTEAPATEAPSVPVEISMSIGGTEMMGGVNALTGDSVTFEWGATGNVSGYAVVVYEGESEFYRADPAGTSGVFRADQLKPGVVYTIRVGAKPADGGETVWTEAKFGVPAPQATEAPKPTDVPATEAPKPTDVPATEAPKPTDVPATEAPKPTDVPVAEVTAPTILIGNETYMENEVPYVTDAMLNFSWTAEGDVMGYLLYVVDVDGNRIDLPKTTETALTLDVTEYPANLYRLYVGTVPVGATGAEQAVWSFYTFGIAG